MDAVLVSSPNLTCSRGHRIFCLGGRRKGGGGEKKGKQGGVYLVRAKITRLSATEAPPVACREQQLVVPPTEERPPRAYYYCAVSAPPYNDSSSAWVNVTQVRRARVTCDGSERSGPDGRPNRAQ